MAQFFPEFEELVILDSLTDGEIKLLSFFKNNLDDKFEIYYRPFINGDNPTVVLLKQNSGAFIFDVFEHPLTKFEELLTVTENGVFNDFKSPIYKVIEYKHNLYNLHIERLLEFNIKDNRHWKVVNCGIYFNLIPSMDLVKIKHNKYFELIGSDNLNKDDFGKILENNGLLTTSEYFKDIFYKSFLRFLNRLSIKLKMELKLNILKSKKSLLKAHLVIFLLLVLQVAGKLWF